MEAVPSSSAMESLVYQARQQQQQMAQQQQQSTPLPFVSQSHQQLDSSCMMDLFLASPPGDLDDDLQPMAKRRRRLNAPETQLLTDVFVTNQKPNAQLRTELGEKLGMTPRAVQIWYLHCFHSMCSIANAHAYTHARSRRFQNKRAKLKKDPNSPIVGKAPLAGGTVGSSANQPGYDCVYGNMKSQQMYYPYPQQGGRFPPFPTPPAHTMATLASPRNPLPTLDLASSTNWVSPPGGYSQAPGNSSAAPSSSSLPYYTQSFPFDTQTAARRSANAFSDYQARRSAPLTVVGGALATSSPASGVMAPTTSQLYNALQNMPTGPGWSLPVGPLSFIGSKNEFLKNRPSFPSMPCLVSP
jgi:hypothetical protein